MANFDDYLFLTPNGYLSLAIGDHNNPYHCMSNDYGDQVTAAIFAGDDDTPYGGHHLDSKYSIAQLYFLLRIE